MLIPVFTCFKAPIPEKTLLCLIPYQRDEFIV